MTREDMQSALAAFDEVLALARRGDRPVDAEELGAADDVVRLVLRADAAAVDRTGTDGWGLDQPVDENYACVDPWYAAVARAALARRALVAALLAHVPSASAGDLGAAFAERGLDHGVLRWSDAEITSVEALFRELLETRAGGTDALAEAGAALRELAEAAAAILYEAPWVAGPPADERAMALMPRLAAARTFFTSVLRGRGPERFGERPEIMRLFRDILVLNASVATPSERLRAARGRFMTVVFELIPAPEALPGELGDRIRGRLTGAAVLLRDAVDGPSSPGALDELGQRFRDVITANVEGVEAQRDLAELDAVQLAARDDHPRVVLERARAGLYEALVELVQALAVLAPGDASEAGDA